jgi:uncharacterized protein (TIGR03382 family)
MEAMKTVARLSASLLALAAPLLAPAVAQACGGFFCQNVPVDQTGENIVFVADGTTVQAFVQVQYQGEATEFAWIIPTPSLPEVGVSSDAIFGYFAQNYRRAAYINTTYHGTCGSYCWDDQFAGGDAAQDTSSADAGTGGGVEVIEQGQTGPYDFAILRATDAQVLFDWLGANDYNLPATAIAAVEPYALMGDETHFVALRLQKDASVGDLQPVKLTYAAEQPMVPIQLTAIAAQPNMPIYVTVLGASRAVPENYLDAVLIEAPQTYYGTESIELIGNAVDQAGGHAFVTTFAGPTGSLPPLFVEGESYRTDGLAELTDAGAFLRELRSRGFTGSPELLSMLQQFLPLPQPLADQGYTAQQFYNDLTQPWGCSFACAFANPPGFDAVGFAAALDSRIVAPLREMQALIEAHPYGTRMVTTLDPAEMTVDPVFAFAPSLPPVNDPIVVQADVYCGENGLPWTAPAIFQITEGVEATAAFGDQAALFGTLAAAPLAYAQQLSAAGEPVLTVDARSGVAATVAAWNSTHTGIVAEVQECNGGGGGGFDTGAADDVSTGSDAGSASDTGSSDAGNGTGTTVVCDGANCEAVDAQAAPKKKDEPGLFGCSAGGSEAGLFAAAGLLAMLASQRRRRR